MRIGAIADIHANKPALEAVLDDMPPVDRLVCAGDVVGYYPWPAACLETVRDRDIPCVQGNHDRAVATGDAAGFNAMARAGVAHARQELADRDLDWLRALPTERTVAERRIAIVHGHPDDPDRYTFPAQFGPDLLRGREALILGHTHVQHAETYPEGVVVNPGSVGQPRDGDRRAAYAIVDLEEGKADLQRVRYDLDPVVEAVAAAGLPRRLGDRLRHGR